MAKLNIVTVIVDALRFDVLCRVIHSGLSSNLSQIVKGNSFFKDCYALTNVTDSSLTTIFTGLHPLTHGVLSHGDRLSSWETKRAHKLNTLPKILSRNGYFTIAVDFLDRWHSQGFHIYKTPSASLLMQKISQFFGFLTSKPTANIFISRITQLVESVSYKTRLPSFLKAISDCISNRFFKHFVTGLGGFTNTKYFTNFSLNLLNKISKLSKPFFLLIHYWNTHSPYHSEGIDIERVRKIVERYHKEMDMPLNNVLKRIKHPLLVSYLKNWFKLRKLKDTLDVISQYYAAILDIDKQIGKIINFLEEKNLLDNTILIVTGDHGESLGEHDIYFDHHGLYEVNLKVPLIIFSPKLANEGMFNIMMKNNHITHLDTVPTLLDLLNLPKDSLKFDGQSLLRERKDNSLIVAIETYTETKLSAKNGDWKIITSITPKEAMCRYCGRIHGGLNELYDLKKDPHETKNIAQDYPEIFNSLKNLASKYLARFKLYHKLSRLSIHLKKQKRKNKHFK